MHTGGEDDFEISHFRNYETPWPWPWIGYHGITYRPLPTQQISFTSENLL